MRLLRLISQLLCVTSAALFGNWVGQLMRDRYTGEPGHQLNLVRTNAQGETVVAVNPLFTNLLPGIVGSLMGRPHWVSAFIYGALASFLLGDQYEGKFLEYFKR
jgi:hypothetical protein